MPLRNGVFFLCLFLFINTLQASPPGSRGARPLALGNGYTAIAGDPYGLYYNPAGLAEINQKEIVSDYGRSHSIGEWSRSDFNGLYAMPYRYKDIYVPLAFGLYGESPAPGAHIIDLTAGGGFDSPMDRWTQGKIKFPVRLGAAGTIRVQQGAGKSDRVGKSRLGLGLTGGAYIPINRNNQLGLTLRDIYPSKTTNPDGPSIHFGAFHRHQDYLNMLLDLEYDSGGIWKVSPGLEWLLARGVVRPRLGWGFRDTGGVDTVATGIGFYVSPMQIDIAYLIPTKTLNDSTDQFRASFSYRFGTPQFSEIYYDRALEAASELDKNVLSMSVKEAELKASLAELQQKNRITQEELNNSKSRIESLKNQDLLGQRDAKIKKLEQRVLQLEDDLSFQRNETKSLRQKQSSIRVHTVKAGDTLQNLAKEYYDDPNQWKKIYNANTDKIDRGLPRIGEKLVIP